MSRARRAALLIGLGVLIGAPLGAVALSRSLRTSLSAAYRAFRDPGLVDRQLPLPGDGACATSGRDPACAARATSARDEPRALAAFIAREFEPATDDDLGDPEGATLATLAMPDLRVPITRRTMHFVRFFARAEDGRAVFLERFRRAGAYREPIEHALREAGLPEDLVWVAAIESGFDPRAVSPQGAAGLWQFMPATGEAYGLERSEWVDARRSIGRATTAAVTHLRDLYERFGRWDLALAAYNLGYDGVLRAMDRAAEAREGALEHAARGPTGFAELAQAGAIPEETMDYVPRIMAFAIVAANRARFGLDAPDLGASRPLDAGELAVPAGTRLRTIARAAGVSAAVLRDYNPELLRDRVPPTGGDYLVSLPAERVARTLATFPAYLEHEVLSLDEAAAAVDPAARDGGPSSSLSPLSALSPDEDEALPRRPAPLGQNRLPVFALPGQAPMAMPVLGDPAALSARLPVAVAFESVGWHRPFEGDPLGILSDRAAPWSALRSAGRSDLPRSLKGREAAIEKQLGFLDALGGDRAERYRLANGIAVEVRADPAAPIVSISASIAAPAPWASRADDAEDAGSSGRTLLGETRWTIAVPARDLDVGVELVAARLRLLLGEASAGRLAELRRQAGAARRRALEAAPYGRAWLALGEALFPAGHPLEGSVIGARDEAFAAGDLLLTEALRRERTPALATVSVVGDVTRAAVEPALARALERLPADAASRVPIGPHPRDERILIEDAVPAPRALYGWIAPAEGDPGEAPVRVAMAILADPRIGRLAKALVTDGQLATEVGGRLSLGERASVAALELTPSPSRDPADVERRLDAELASLAAIGPTWKELALAKALLKAELTRELSRVADGGAGAARQLADLRPRPVTGARIRGALTPDRLPHLLAAIDEVEPSAVRAVAANTFARAHRVVVATWPRGSSVAAAASGVSPSSVPSPVTAR